MNPQPVVAGAAPGPQNVEPLVADGHDFVVSQTRDQIVTSAEIPHAQLQVPPPEGANPAITTQEIPSEPPSDLQSEVLPTEITTPPPIATEQSPNPAVQEIIPTSIVAPVPTLEPSAPPSNPLPYKQPEPVVSPPVQPVTATKPVTLQNNPAPRSSVILVNGQKKGSGGPDTITPGNIDEVSLPALMELLEGRIGKGVT